ncbi:MAG: ABC transporter permease [Actinomycetota bacterium]|nr:ABC transporter permease [Actinomycetota bacterium]
MTATLELTRTEARLFARDPVALLFGLLLPAALLVGLGAFFPGFDEPASELDGDRYIDVYAPVGLALGVATLGLVTLPPILGGYRQLGILRRLRTTPVHPARLLAAELVVHGIAAAVAALVAVVAVVAAFDVAWPAAPGWFAISFVATICSAFAIGLLIGAIVRTQAAGQAIGMAVYFPMLFLAGVWVPRHTMSDGLRDLSDRSPSGAAVQAMADAWDGSTPDATHLVTMAAYALVASLLAVRVFRWE